MAAITVDPKKVRVVRADSEHYRHAPTSAALERGTVVVEDANGKWVAGNGATNGQRVGILLHKSLSANEARTALQGPSSIVDIGDHASVPAIGAVVYATAGGAFDDAATGNRRVGEIIAGHGQEFGGSPRRLLQLD